MQEVIVYAVFTLLFLGAGIICAVEAAALDTYYYYTRPNYYGSLHPFNPLAIVASVVIASVIRSLFLTHFFPMVSSYQKTASIFPVWLAIGQLIML